MQVSQRLNDTLRETYLPTLAKSIYGRYTRQQKEYHDSIHFVSKNNDHRYHIHPILLDIFFSGVKLPFATSTLDTYDEQCTHDAAALLLHDRTLSDSTFGRLRCRDKVTPLYAACINPSVPLWIVQQLLRVSDGNHSILVNGNLTHILNDLENTVSCERLSSLTRLFCTGKASNEEQHQKNSNIC